jgi:hypothetical protein
MKRGLCVLLDLLGLAGCALLLALASATVAWWVRSYWVADSFWFNGVNEVRALVLSNGKIELYRQSVRDDAPFRVTASYGHHAQDPSPPRLRESGLATAWEQFGFGYAAGADAMGSRRMIVVPCWATAAVAGIVPAWWLWQRKRRRIAWLRSQKRCIRCGYDLRATPDRCPECGTPAQTGVGA